MPRCCFWGKTGRKPGWFYEALPDICKFQYYTNLMKCTQTADACLSVEKTAAFTLLVQMHKYSLQISPSNFPFLVSFNLDRGVWLAYTSK